MRKIELRKVSIKNDVRLLYDMMLGEDQYLFSTKLHIAKLNGRICGAKRSHSVFEQPNCYQSV